VKSKASLRSVLASNIRNHAKERGKALNTWAELAGVSRAQLYAVLGRRTAPSIDWLEKLAEAIDVEPWKLLVPPESPQRVDAPKGRKKRA
jgi:lambda repressor-like predicted transcriptional regulator